MSTFAGVLAPLADPRPADNDVVAGWVGFAVFMFLVVAVALLLWSFTRHLRKARVNFGVESRPTSIPRAGTAEGDRALAESLLVDDRSEPQPPSGGKHRGSPEGERPTS